MPATATEESPPGDRAWAQRHRVGPAAQRTGRHVSLEGRVTLAVIAAAHCGQRCEDLLADRTTYRDVAMRHDPKLQSLQSLSQMMYLTQQTSKLVLPTSATSSCRRCWMLTTSKTRNENLHAVKNDFHGNVQSRQCQPPTSNAHYRWHGS